MLRTLTGAPATGAAARSAAEREGQWLMIAGGVLLGTLGLFVEEAGQSPLCAVWFRCAFGALALTAWIAITGRWPELRMNRRGAIAAVAAGVLMIVNWTLFFGAIGRTSIGVATVVFHIQPLWVMALGVWWLRERVSALQCAAALVALAGLALASGLPETSWQDVAFTESYAVGVAMCLGGSLSYAAVTMIAKCAKSVGSLALAWTQCVVGTVALLWWPLLDGLPPMGAAWAWLAGLGVLHTGLAYVILYAGMSRLPAARVAVLQFVYPAAAVLFDWVFYGRTLSAMQWAGVLLMLLALSAIARRRASA